MKDPNFDIAFSFGKFNIYWYAILLAAGIAAAMLIADRRAKGRAVPKDISLDLCILGVPFGILGARLFACLSGMVAWSDFFDLTHSGLSFFGGLIFAALAIVVYLKLRKTSVNEMLDIAAPGVFAGIGIAVWGDFFNRSHYGPLVEKQALKWFPLATYGSDLKVHYAAFFYEFLLCILLIVLYYALLRKALRNKGNRFLLMALVYCLGRFCIDSIRQDMIMIGSIAFDQICEIALAVLCLLLLFLNRKSQDTAPEAENQPTPEKSEPLPAEEKAKEEPTPAPEQKADEEAAPESKEQGETFSGLN